MSIPIIDIIGLALTLAKEVMEKMPDYDQKKKEKFYELTKRYQDEKNSINRDDRIVDELYDELCIFLKAFTEEISGKKV